jgi:mannobiose 2-epimerase
MEEELKQYKLELQPELQKILGYWMQFAVDVKGGGFVGKIDNDNHVSTDAPKGSELNSGILWSFAAAYHQTKKVQYLQMAERAYKYICSYFIDKKFGGVYWTVDVQGNPLDTKKVICAQALALNSLSEYYKVSGEEGAKEKSITLYKLIVQYGYDQANGGYIEALTSDWKQVKDSLFTTEDFLIQKSLHTQLHVLESFANLYLIWPNEKLKQEIQALIHLFTDQLINKETGHVLLFFDEQWKAKSSIHSFGNDIEAAWMIVEATKIIDDKALLETIKKVAIKMIGAATEGLDKDGGLYFDFNKTERLLNKEKRYWSQAEAMVGFFTAWQMTGDETYLEKSIRSWHFIQKHILHKERGEWIWGVTEDHKMIPGQDKAGMYKSPYHNSRACLEIIQRIENVLSNSGYKY